MTAPAKTPRPPKEILCSLNPRVNSAPAPSNPPAQPVAKPAIDALTSQPPAQSGPTLDQVEKTLEPLFNKSGK